MGLLTLGSEEGILKTEVQAIIQPPPPPSPAGLFHLVTLLQTSVTKHWTSWHLFSYLFNQSKGCLQPAFLPQPMAPPGGCLRSSHVKLAFLKGTLGDGTEQSEGHSGGRSFRTGTHFRVTWRTFAWPHVWQYHSGDGRDWG